MMKDNCIDNIWGGEGRDVCSNIECKIAVIFAGRILISESEFSFAFARERAIKSNLITPNGKTFSSIIPFIFVTIIETPIICWFMRAIICGFNSQASITWALTFYISNSPLAALIPNCMFPTVWVVSWLIIDITILLSVGCKFGMLSIISSIFWSTFIGRFYPIAAGV